MIVKYPHNRTIIIPVSLDVNLFDYSTIKALDVFMDKKDIDALLNLPMGTQGVVLKRIREGVE